MSEFDLYLNAEDIQRENDLRRLDAIPRADHLAEIERLESENKKLTAERDDLQRGFTNGFNETRALKAANAKLRDALNDAIETIRIWHGKQGWEIYRDNSPEMKRMFGALKAHPTGEPKGESQ